MSQIRYDLDNGNRICNRCREEKSLDDFPKDKKCSGGRARTCKTCVYKKRDLNNIGREKEVQEYKQRWYNKNREKVLNHYHTHKKLKDRSTKTCIDCNETKSSSEFVKQRKLCKKCANVRGAVWRKNNIERARDRDKKYRENLDEDKRYSILKRWREKNRNYLREWRAKNPHKTRSYKIKRRSLELTNGRNDLSSEQIKFLFDIFKTCQYCGSSKDLTIDHIIPLSRGGENTFDNVTVACRRCNSRKGNKII